MRHFVSGVIVATLTTAMPFQLSGQVRVGVNGGLTVGRISTDASDIDGDPFAIDDRISFQAGGVLVIPVGRTFQISTELDYVRAGFGLDVMPAGTSQIDLDVDIDRLDVPVLAGVRFPIGSGVVAPRVYGGPFVAFELRCHSTTASGTIVLEEGSCDDSGIDRKETDWGVVLGGGVDVAVASGVVFSLEARYTVGLRNLNTSDPPDDEAFRTRTFALLGGLSISIGR